MSKQICECGHPEANHTTGPCSTEVLVMDDPRHVVLCQCKKFTPQRETVTNEHS